MGVEVHPWLRALPPAVHGGVTAAELMALGLDPTAVIDFSVNTNPLGPSPRVLAAVRNADVSRYPDPEAAQLRAALAGRLGVPVEAVLAGNGSVELLWLVALAFLAPGGTAVVAGPTFGEYARAAAVAGAGVREVRAAAAAGFIPDLDRLRLAVTGTAARLLFICNPNNPTGVLLPASDLTGLARSLPGTLVLVDEAYLPFTGETPGGRCGSAVGSSVPNLVVLGSLTKDCAIPGLRLGYAAGDPAVIAALRAAQPTWSVNALAQAAGLAALADHDHWARSHAAVVAARSYLMDRLCGLGLAPLPTAANFILLPTGSGRAAGYPSGAALRRALLAHGCCVRDGASFGLPQHVRIGIRTIAECRWLVSAIEAVLT